MNARSQVFEIAVEPRQVEECVLSIFHTVLFHRTLGKFTYQEESQYFIGAVGYEDVDCEYSSATYVRPASPRLCERVRHEVAAFSAELRRSEAPPSSAGAPPPPALLCPPAAPPPPQPQRHRRSGTVSLEFYQKKRRWPFAVDNIPWEVWTVRTELHQLDNEQERQQWQEKVGEIIADKVMYICEVMNRHEYVPKMPSFTDLDLVFDTSFDDVQPYLFKISYATSDPVSPSVGTTVRKLLKDTLAI